MKLTHILLDADDTVFDFQAASEASLAHCLEKHGLPSSHELCKEFDTINHGLWKQLEKGLLTETELKERRFRLFFEKLGLPYPDGFGELFVETLAEKGGILREEAREVVPALAEKYTLAIVTNGFSYVQHRRFDHSELSPYFSGIFISGDIGLRKPDVRYFDWVLNGLGDPERGGVLIVGDSLSSDMQGGMNAGIHTCWLNTANAPLPSPAPELVIRSLRELLTIL